MQWPFGTWGGCRGDFSGGCGIGIGRRQRRRSQERDAGPLMDGEPVADGRVEFGRRVAAEGKVGVGDAVGELEEDFGNR